MNEEKLMNAPRGGEWVGPFHNLTFSKTSGAAYGIASGRLKQQQVGN